MSGVRVSFPEDAPAELQIASADERKVTLDRDRLAALADAVTGIEQAAADGKLDHGLVVCGGPTHVFCAGADLDLMASMETREEREEAIHAGQDIFDRIASLPCRTVAAVRGNCVGGGLELALACDVVLASTEKTTKVGLPEVRLGLLPAWGGTRRIIAKAGLARALPLVLAGSVLPAKVMAAKGVVDEAVPGELLLERARAVARGDAEPRRRRAGLVQRLMSAPPLAGIPLWIARGKVRSGAAAPYPAPRRIVATAARAVFAPGTARKAEINGGVDLLATPEHRALLHVFRCSEAQRHLARDLFEGDLPPTRRALVAGAGQMGAAIALGYAQAGLSVRLRDPSDDALFAAGRMAARTARKLSKKRRLTRSEAQALTDRFVLDPAMHGERAADLFLEAAPEKLEIKQAVFRAAVDAGLPRDALILTNTSTLPVTEMAVGLPNPGRVAGMHFFHPVAKMPLVEIVRAEQTSDETLARVAALAVAMGKTPVIVADRPGFLVNRLLAPYMGAAGRLLDDGVPLAAIDAAAKAFGMPMGPLRLADEVGLDVALSAARVLHAAFGDRMKPHDEVVRMVEGGLLGAKSGRGFYDHTGSKPVPAWDSPSANGAAPSASEIIDVLFEPMFAEARLCLDEGVVASDDELDIASVFGTGFPPFRRGGLGACALSSDPPSHV